VDGRWQLAPNQVGADPEVPRDLRRLIELQLERLDTADIGMLEAAAVAGSEFAAATAGCAEPLATEEVEERAATLARQGRFLRATGSVAWLDGTVSAGFAFVHDLHRAVLLDRVPTGRRARLHAAVAARLERAYGPSAGEHAAELATRFLQGQDHPKAVRYLQAAAEQALRRSAHREAIQHLEVLLQTLPRLPQGADRDQAELAAQMLLGPALIATRGFASPEVEATYTRARELCTLLERPRELSLVLHGLAAVNEFRGRYHVSEELLAEVLRIGDAELVVEAHELLACSTFHQGAAARAVGYAERALRCTARAPSTGTWRPTGSTPPSVATTGRRWRCGSSGVPTAPCATPSRRGRWPRRTPTAWPAPRSSWPTYTSTAASHRRPSGGPSRPARPRSGTASRSAPPRRPSSVAGPGP
jgi:hypothetical protein